MHVNGAHLIRAVRDGFSRAIRHAGIAELAREGAWKITMGVTKVRVVQDLPLGNSNHCKLSQEKVVDRPYSHLDIQYLSFANQMVTTATGQ